jgi:eukaryotic-like serine/threonine-protein kinase
MTPSPAPAALCPRCGTALSAPAVGASYAICPACAFAGALQSEAPPGSTDESDDWMAAFETEKTADAGDTTARRFGSYELFEELGRGGMGVVYRAQQSHPSRIVALKVILPLQSSTPGMIGRFKAEAETIASLDHPHILPVYEAGERDGMPFFSMKFAGGGTLAAHLRDFDGKTREAVELLAAIAHAVDHAHRRGILHRDLKPGNILLDAQGNPYVADFGMAKWLGRDHAATLTGMAVGTPSYMAPEQATGRSADLTVAADIYSLGGILYELLLQRPPFAADSVVEVLRQVADQQPVAPRSVRANIPRDVETICLKCLAKEPAQRYATAEALALDLERWLEGRPIHARPLGAMARTWRWAQRNRVPASLAAILLGILLAVAVGSSIAARRLSIARAETTEQLRSALLAQAKASRLTGRLGQRFETLAALKKAAAIRPDLDLREQALAAFALPDARFGPNWNLRHASNSPVAFDSTGARFVVETDAGVLSLRRTADGGELRRFAAPPGNPRAIYVAALSSDDKKFAARFADDRVRVYDLESESPLWELTARPVCQMNAVFAYDFAFTPDGQQLAIGLPEGGVSFHDAATGRETARLDCGFVPAVIDFSPDGEKIALAALRKTDVIIFDRASGRAERTLSHPKSIVSCAWRPDGKQLAVACFDNRIHLWDAATGAQVAAIRGHTETPSQLAWRRDSRLLASTGRDQTIRLWDPEDGAPLLIIPRVLGEPCLRFARDGRSLGYAGDDTKVGRIELISDDFRRDWLRLTPGDNSSTYGGLDVSSDGLLMTVSSHSGVRVLDARDGTLLAELPGLSPGVNTAQFTPTSDALVYSSAKIGTWRRDLRWIRPDALEIGSAVQVDPRPEFFVSEVRGNPARVSLIGEKSNSASIISLADGGAPVDLPLAGEPENCTIHPSEAIAVTSDREGDEAAASDVRIWNTTEGKLIKRLALGRDGSARFSYDGALLWVSGGDNSAVLHWPDLTPAITTPISGFDGWFSPDRSQIAIGDDNEIVLMKLPGGKTVGHLPGSAILNLRYSADGARIFAYMNFHVYAWELGAVRRELATLGLDWEGPALPPFRTGPPGPIKATIQN